MSTPDPNLPTFTVEDGTVVTGANSYTTTSYALAYLALNPHVASIWEAMDTWQQQGLLMWATKYIDQRATWNGQTTTSGVACGFGGTNYVAEWAVSSLSTATSQPLRWPRVGVYDIDGNPIAGNVIPTALQDAVCELARYQIDQDRTTERAQDGLTEIRADVVTLKFLVDYELPAVPDQISFMIRGLGSISSGRTFGAKIRRA